MRYLAVALLCTFLSAGCNENNPPSSGTSSDLTTPSLTVPVALSDTPQPDHSWPRVYQKAGNTVVMYQPQVDSWKDYDRICFRSAIALTTASTGKTEYGILAVQGETLVDHDAKTVLITNLDVALRFPSANADQATLLKSMVKELLPNVSTLSVSLPQVLSYMHNQQTPKPVEVNLNPPQIYYSDSPALLVIYMGQPQFKPIKDTQLMFAVNTNWNVFMDMKSGQYFLLDGDSWLTAPDPLKGPWTPATTLPADLSKLPKGENWDDVTKNIPGTPIKTVPRIITSTEPAELLVTTGSPDYTPIPGTRLMYVSNPVMPLFLDLIDSNYYYLASGRWFRGKTLNGPWSAASADLPLEFAKIPSDSPMGFVLASIPRTQEAMDAILLASVPHKATINITDAKVAVVYDGQPKFIAIEGTSMTYAVNTSYQVIFASGKYYCCYQGVWFVAPAATGPFAVCTSVPAAIYTIPASSPVHNVTYVTVYSSTPTTVVVGYTAGYSGEYVAATGALMFGAGMLTGALIASNNNWYGCPPSYYSYGCAAHYSYAYGGYYRAAGSYYGPHGGAGWGSAYNPATGTWARGGAAYGPSGAHWGAQAYNPFTNTYAAHTGGTNGYQSWGSSVVQKGDGSWAQAGHTTTAKGTAGWASNSEGEWAKGVHTANGTVGTASNGDVYAGHDGNVYKKSDGQWQKYSGSGNWEDTNWNKPSSSSYKQTSSALSESSYQDRMNQYKSSGQSSPFKSSGENTSEWKNNFESRSSSSEGGWGQHNTESSLNRDSWSREQSNSWSERSSSAGSERSGGWGSERSSGGGRSSGFSGGGRGGGRR